MNILLIDDQPTIISSLLSGISWYELGFSSIFTATNAKNARKILKNNHIDIVVSDIEMPYETGLELLTWAREEGFNFECILLTSHANFSYAQTAIRLKVTEYITQPAKNEDIVRAVKRAVQALKSNSVKQIPTQKSGRLSYAAQNIVAKKMFAEWPSIEQAIVYPDQLEARIKDLQQFGIHCDCNSFCTLFIIHIRKWKKLPLSISDFLLKYETLYNELFPTDNQASISFYLKENMYFTIIFSPNPSKIPEGLKELFNQIPKQIGAIVRLFHTTTEIRFLKNAMDGLITYANTYTLGHFNDIQMIEMNSTDLYTEATGSMNYEKYHQMIHDYIKVNISEAIGRNDIADHLHISPDNVSYIIKETDDMTVKELINHIKMEHARALLRNTEYAISEIAQKCGYDSFAYFSKVYRTTYGITPSQERH